MYGITKEQLEVAIKVSNSRSDVIRYFGWCVGGGSSKKLYKLLDFYGISVDILEKKRIKAKIKYPYIDKICPVCNKTFTTKKGDPKEKITCSHLCANNFFKVKGQEHHNYKTGKYAVDGYGKEYRNLCFEYYEYKCLLCDWDLVVDVHHLDCNHDNNNIKNLIPLCPNHHKIIHMNEYKKEIKKDILSNNNYILNRRIGFGKTSSYSSDL